MWCTCVISGIAVPTSCNVLNSLSVCGNALLLTRDSSYNVSPSSVEDKCFGRAIGASHFHSEGAPYRSFWGQLWLQIIAIRNSHYNLPNGSIGCDFVGLLSSEVNLLVQGSMRSERVNVFLTVILQRNPIVKSGADIRCLLL